MTTEVSRRFARLICLAALATSACSAAGRSGAGAAPQPRTDAAADFEAIYRARTDSARMRFTEADVRFVAGMIGHHAQALVMAGLAPTHGASPALQTLAGRIINAQKDEIALMQEWLRDRGQPVPEVHVAGMEVHGVEHAAHMPGMLTQEQLRELDQARGADFDRLFLTYMIQHHKGAVTMVLELFRTDGALQDEPLFKIASDIQVDQATEIARMERMLATLPGAGGAP